MNDNIQFWQWCGKNGTFIHCWWECKMGNILAVLNKLIPKLPDNPGHSSQRNEDLYVHTKPCRETATTVLLVIAPKWIQPAILQWVMIKHVVHLCCEILFSGKKEQTMHFCHSLGESPEIKLSAKTTPRGCILFYL